MHKMIHSRNKQKERRDYDNITPLTFFAEVISQSMTASSLLSSTLNLRPGPTSIIKYNEQNLWRYKETFLTLNGWLESLSAFY